MLRADGFGYTVPIYEGRPPDLTAGDAEQIKEFVTDLLSGYYTDPEDQPPPDAQLH